MRGVDPPPEEGCCCSIAGGSTPHSQKAGAAAGGVNPPGQKAGAAAGQDGNFGRDLRSPVAANQLAAGAFFE